MHELTRFFARLCVALLAVALGPGTARADYPDYAPRPPQDQREGAEPWAGRADSLRPVEAAEPRADAPPRFPLRQPAERQAGAPSVLASDNSTAPERLVAHERAIPLVGQSSDAKPGPRGREMPALLTGAASLGIVLGLFLLVVWAVRRGMSRNPALLPREAVEVLGRAPLIGRHQVHLVRCGNKILLLNVSAASVETLTEITDPIEIDRLAGICEQATAHKGPASFRQVFGQFGRPRGLEYLPGHEADELDFAHLEAGAHHRAQEAHA